MRNLRNLRIENLRKKKKKLPLRALRAENKNKDYSKKHKYGLKNSRQSIVEVNSTKFQQYEKKFDNDEKEKNDS